MKALLTLAILFSSTFAMADWEEQQKQNDAKALFEASSTAQAVKNSKFFKQWPTEYFANAGRSSLTHDDCISGDTYYGGYTVKCTEWEDVFENEENDGEPGEWTKKCVTHSPIKLVKPANQAPKSVTVKFYRQVTGLTSVEQVAGSLYVGKGVVSIPSCN